MIQPVFLVGEVSATRHLNILEIGRPGEWSESPDTLINALVTATPDSLTIWHVHVDGELYNSSDEKLGFNELCMTCYFNLGVDAEIGNSKL